MVSSNPGLSPLGASSPSPPSYAKQRCLQTLPMSPGNKITLAENHCYRLKENSLLSVFISLSLII